MTYATCIAFGFDGAFALTASVMVSTLIWGLLVYGLD